MKALHIGFVNLRRMLRERSNIFFVFIFPIAIVLLIGVQFGGGVRPVLAVYDGDGGAIATSIQEVLAEDEGVEILSAESQGELVTMVERGSAQAGLAIPPAIEEAASGGERVEFEYISRPDGSGPQLQSVAGAAISEVMKPVGAAQFAAVETGATYDVTLSVADSLIGETEPISVDVRTVGDALFPASMGRFDLGAPSQLVLFVFLTALAGSSVLILTRQLGISGRMMSTPTSLRTIVLGESIGRFSTAMVQGLYIMVLTLLIFGVNWGDPVGALLLLIALAAVGAGAGVLVGSTFSNDQQAGGISIILSLGLAALGGAMFPAELFSPTMQTVAKFTPHAWAIEGYAKLIRHGGSVTDVLPELGVLTAFAVVLLSLSSWRLRAAITRS